MGQIWLFFKRATQRPKGKSSSNYIIVIFYEYDTKQIRITVFSATSAKRISHVYSDMQMEPTLMLKNDDINENIM